ncbi:sulfur carrier protein ThiS [Candidatus Berkiella aquae]|uniref:Sulfur carrier protein ThiS n=1 Tax=Candidatus Berkiella aquae TaxID=295108 RepID=A0A0Q9YNA9_9GAMM|nr:sulfur carrier protein ThiS [Candidatus Berkiella aquae]MCS5712605.1 sulfur carrier protein ThiS [Candidatus Berkiella aquae]
MNKISVKINQQVLDIAANETLQKLLQGMILPSIYAIAINGKFLPKEQYLQYQLKQGDEIAVLTPMQGG